MITLQKSADRSFYRAKLGDRRVTVRLLPEVKTPEGVRRDLVCVTTTRISKKTDVSPKRTAKFSGVLSCESFTRKTASLEFLLTYEAAEALWCLLGHMIHDNALARIRAVTAGAGQTEGTDK